MITGSYERKLDKQNRVSVPSEVIGALTRSPKEFPEMRGFPFSRRPKKAETKESLIVYVWPTPLSDGLLMAQESLFRNWHKQFQISKDGANQQKVLTAIFSTAERCSIYGPSNRVTIPTQHRHFFQDGLIHFVGMGQMIALFPKRPKIDDKVIDELRQGLLWPTAPQ